MPTLALAILGMLVLVGCGQALEGNRAPDFSFTLYQGEEVLGGTNLKLSDLQGKPVVLNFWAGSCPPCRLEMPDFQAFYNESHDRITLIGVDIGPFVGLGSTQDARDLLRQLNITYPAGYALDVEPVRQYQVVNMPTTVFIDAEGAIFRVWPGLLDAKILDVITRDMLAQSPA